MNMILTYVPESEHLTYDGALALAEERDAQAASELAASAPLNAVLTTYQLSLLSAWERTRQWR